jgi:hypothetical protein
LAPIASLQGIAERPLPCNYNVLEFVCALSWRKRGFKSHREAFRFDIAGFVDESFPGFVRCVFEDANGNRHTTIEKIPVVTIQELWSDSITLNKGTAPCEFLLRF